MGAHRLIFAISLQVAACAPVLAQGPNVPKLTPLPHPNIAPPEAPVQDWPWWLVVELLILVLALVGFIVWLLFRPHPQRVTPPDLPWKRAMAALTDLQPLLDQLPPPEISHRVSVILREYQLGRYQLPAPCRTSEELYPPPVGETLEPSRRRFKPVSEIYDRLSFATQPATRAAASKLIENAIQVLQDEQSPSPPPLPS